MRVHACLYIAVIENFFIFFKALLYVTTRCIVPIGVDHKVSASASAPQLLGVPLCAVVYERFRILGGSIWGECRKYIALRKYALF